MSTTPLVAARSWSAGRSATGRHAPASAERPGLNAGCRAPALALQSPATLVQLLELLGVPFATFGASGECTRLSIAAARLFGDGAGRICRLGAPLVERLLAGGEDTVSTLSPDGAQQLRGHRLPGGDPRRAAILLILPGRATGVEVDWSRWRLTRREVDVAALLAGGASARDAASVLGISCHTVRRHTERIFAKVGVRSRAQLIAVVCASHLRAVTRLER